MNFTASAFRKPSTTIFLEHTTHPVLCRQHDTISCQSNNREFWPAICRKSTSLSFTKPSDGTPDGWPPRRRWQKKKSPTRPTSFTCRKRNSIKRNLSLMPKRASKNTDFARLFAEKESNTPTERRSAPVRQKTNSTTSNSAPWAGHPSLFSCIECFAKKPVSAENFKSPNR